MKKENPFSIDGIWLRDSEGRARILRGCNISGATKLPTTPSGETHLRDSLSTAEISFVGRPFAEDEADEHFARLKSWGFTFLRWLITWEAVEHAGPEQYDEDYLAYVRRLLKKCEEYGISVFIDPHQDVWSRFTGGDGAPAWTLEAIGFDLSKLSVTGAAHTHQSEGDDYRQMTWFLNRDYYACATMFTLFFAGDVFAPHLQIEGEGVQSYLQNHFINAMVHTARRLKDCKAIVGFGSFNEPTGGYIGCSNLAAMKELSSPRGYLPTPFEAMKAASGYEAQFADCKLTLFGTKVVGQKIVNSDGVSLFKEGYDCPWKKAGVWGLENNKPVLLKPDYFATANGKPISFAQDCLKPFLKKYIAAFQKKHSHFLFFIEGEPNAPRPSWDKEGDTEFKKIVDAFHWYDGKTLILKQWHSFLTADNIERKPVFGKNAVQKSFTKQINSYAQEIRKEGMPALLGEFGVPFDLAGKKACKTGDYSQQDEALSMYYASIDELLLSSTIWNYTPSNTNEHGDGWNGEDLSIFNRGADGKNTRSEFGFCRPYATATAGTPLRMHFNADKKNPQFEFEWEAIDGTTEIFVPSIWFPTGWDISVTGSGEKTIKIDGDYAYISGASRKCSVTIKRK